MCAKGIYFDGRRIIRPQAVTKIDDTGMYARGLAGGNTLALIGEATGGEPNKVLWFTDPSYAKSILRSGDLLTAIQRAYDPSSTVSGAYLVAAIRVNPAVQSTLALKDASGNPLILLTSVDWGVWNNQIKARIETGTTLGKKVTFTYGTSYDQGDNIYRKSFAMGLSDAKARSGTVTISIGSVTKTLVTAIVANAQKVYFNTGDQTTPAAEDDTNYFPTNLNGTTDHLYIGSDIPFKAIEIGIGGGVPNAQAATLIGEYWNGTEWTTIALTDGTLSGGCTLAISGTISFTVPALWQKTTYQSLSAYWLRLSSSAALTGTATADWAWLERSLSINLVDYPTIQELVDYIDAQLGYEAAILTSNPSGELSIELDDVSAGNLITGGATTLSSGYSSGRVLSVNSITGFAIGDYIIISRLDGSAEEMRRISAIGTLTLTVDSDLSTTYSTGDVVREAAVLNSDLQAVIDWINAGNTSYVEAEYHASATNRAALANIPDTYLSGGSEGTTSQSHWDAALDLLKTEDTPLISCISYDPAVWASLSTHCSYMSTVGKKERIGFCGGFATADGYTNGLGKWTSSSDIGTSREQMLTYANDLNSDRMVYVGPGFKAYDENGLLTTFNGSISAALVAGMAAGVDVATALTHQYIKVLGLEHNFQWADLDRLLEYGVCPFEYDPGTGYRVCQSITSWLVNDKYNRRELSVRRTADFVARQVRDRLEQDFVGKKGTMTTLVSIKNATESVLVQMYRAELLAGNAENPPYKNIQVRLEGDTAWVDFECSPCIPINYIPITIHLTVFTTTLTA
jgi:hypothetical protein